MNERIRELSYEAQKYALNKIIGPDLAGINELWQEKFAELIVRECCQKLETDGMVEVAMEMKEHFGVE
jgi:hypothetical protein